MPREAEAETLQWTIAALHSIEMVSVPWWFVGLSDGLEAARGRRSLWQRRAD